MIKLTHILPEHIIKPKFNLGISSNVKRKIRHLAWSELSKALIKQIKEETKYFDLFEVLLSERNPEVYDITSNFVKEYMIAHHSEFEKGGEEVLASPNSINSLTTEDIKEYIEDTPELKRYLTNLVWKYILSKINIKEEIEVLTTQAIDDLKDMVFNRPDAMLSNLIRHAASVSPARVDNLLLISVDSNMKYFAEELAIELIDTFYLNDSDFAQYLNSTLQKSEMLGEHVVKPSVKYKFKIGQKVVENWGERDKGVILAQRKNLEEVRRDPIDKISLRFLIEDPIAESSDKPWYWVVYTDSDGNVITLWTAESCLEARSTSDMKEHTVKPKSIYKFNIGDEVMYGDYTVIDRRRDLEDARKASKSNEIFVYTLESGNKDSSWYLVQGPKGRGTRWWVPEKTLLSDIIKEHTIKPKVSPYKYAVGTLVKTVDEVEGVITDRRTDLQAVKEDPIDTDTLRFLRGAHHYNEPWYYVNFTSTPINHINRWYTESYLTPIKKPA